MMFQNNLKIAFRSLLRRRTFTAINITGLTLGMVAAIFAFLWAQNEMNFDNYHQNVENIYRVNNNWKFEDGTDWKMAQTPFPIVEVIKNEVPGVLKTATLLENRWRPFTLKKGGLKLKGKRYTYVNQDWFDVFEHQFLSGSPEGFEANIHHAIITRDFAEKLLGESYVVGESFLIDTTEFIVQAVIENHPANSSFSYEMILPMSYYLSIPQNRSDVSWNNANNLTFVKLFPKANPTDFGKNLTLAVNTKIENEEQTYTLQPLTSVHFDESRSSEAMLTGNSQMVYIIGFIGLLILFLAGINYVSLTTAQAGMRTKDVGVRKIIGAEGKQIFQLFFAESLITTAISLIIAASLVQLGMPFFNGFAEKTFQLDLSNPTILTVLGGTLILTILLSGIYPAMFLTKFSPNNFLKGENILKIKNTTFRKGLVVTQFAITVGLIIIAMILFQQQDYIRKKELGYNKSHVFEFSMAYNKERQNTLKAMQQTLAAAPAVLHTATSNGSIIDMKSSTSTRNFDWKGKPEGSDLRVGQFSVDANYQELMELKIVDGRWFLPDNQSDLNNILINETAIKQFQIKAPIIGQNIHFQGTDGQIVGIVKDFHYRNMREKIKPLVFYNNQWSHSTLLVRTTEEQVAEALAVAKKAWTTHHPELPFEYRFMDDSFDQLYRSDQKNAQLFQLLAGLAIFISALGLFGLAVFSTEQRAKEIGIRKVLGASVAGIVGLLSKDFLKLIGIALLLACPLAYYLMEEWLTNYAYRIDIGAGVFLIAGVLTIGVALLTVGMQSMKAAIANPVKTLRSE
ncbi:MAG: ABC transporter permease [Saprospiraceae bacterium]